MESQLDKVLAGPVSNRDLMCFGKAFQRPEIRATIRNISGCAGEQGHGRQRASAGPRSCWQGSARVAVPLQGQPSELWLDDVQPSGRPGSRRPDAGGQLRLSRCSSSRWGCLLRLSESCLCSWLGRHRELKVSEEFHDGVGGVRSWHSLCQRTRWGWRNSSNSLRLAKQRRRHGAGPGGPTVELCHVWLCHGSTMTRTVTVSVGAQAYMIDSQSRVTAWPGQSLATPKWEGKAASRPPCRRLGLPTESHTLGKAFPSHFAMLALLRRAAAAAGTAVPVCHVAATSHGLGVHHNSS